MNPALWKLSRISFYDTIIALGCAKIIPEYDGFRINSMVIPVTAYGLWMMVSRYYEGGWWFKGWNETVKRWW